MSARGKIHLQPTNFPRVQILITSPRVQEKKSIFFIVYGVVQFILSWCVLGWSTWLLSFEQEFFAVFLPPTTAGMYFLVGILAIIAGTDPIKHYKVKIICKVLAGFALAFALVSLMSLGLFLGKIQEECDPNACELSPQLKSTFIKIRKDWGDYLKTFTKCSAICDYYKILIYPLFGFLGAAALMEVAENLSNPNCCKKRRQRQEIPVPPPDQSQYAANVQQHPPQQLPFNPS